MSYKEDSLRSLTLVAALYEVKSIKKVDGHYTVMFVGSSAMLMFDAKTFTKEEIEVTIKEARS